MEKTYFKSSDAIGKDLLAEWEGTQVEVKEKKKKIEAEYNAPALYMSGDYIIGFVLEGHGHEREGFKNSNITEGGVDYTVLKPTGRFKDGKRFRTMATAHQRCVDKAPNFSTFAIRKYGVGRSIVGPHSGRSGMALYSSTAGVAKGHVILAVPCNDKHPIPVIYGFEQIKRSEFIALTEE